MGQTKEKTQNKSERPPVESGPNWLYGKDITFEEQERRRRESRVQRLLVEDEDDILGSAYDSRLLSRLMQFMKPYETKLIVAVVLMVVTAILSVSGPWIVGQAVDSGIRTGDIAALRKWSMLFLFAVSVNIP